MKFYLLWPRKMGQISSCSYGDGRPLNRKHFEHWFRIWSLKFSKVEIWPRLTPKMESNFKLLVRGRHTPCFPGYWLFTALSAPLCGLLCPVMSCSTPYQTQMIVDTDPDCNLYKTQKLKFVTCWRQKGFKFQVARTGTADPSFERILDTDPDCWVRRGQISTLEFSKVTLGISVQNSFECGVCRPCTRNLKFDPFLGQMGSNFNFCVL